MVRYIFCNGCIGKMERLHPEDIANGWHVRAMTIGKSRKPADHKIEIKSPISAHTVHLPSLICDSCNCDIPDGDPVRAVTMWQSPEAEPGNWEQEFTGS